MATYKTLRSDDPKVQQARQRAGKIVGAMNDLAALVQQSWDAKDWRVLGYDSWQSYTVGEFGHGDTAIKARQVIVSMLRGTGLSQRAIAAETGASVATVNNDIADLSTAPPEGDPTTIDRRPRPTVQEPEQSLRVTGLDGRTQPASRGGMTGDQRRERDRLLRAQRRQREAALRETHAADAARPVPDMIHGHPVTVTCPMCVELARPAREAPVEPLAGHSVETRLRLLFAGFLDGLTPDQLTALHDHWDEIMNETVTDRITSWAAVGRTVAQERAS
jgi:hypothetical protein